MRNIYILTAVSFVTAIAVFIGAFFYLDRTKHRSLYYEVEVTRRRAGDVRIDRFVTEDRLIYRSTSRFPFDPLFAEVKSRLTFDAKHRLESYSKESLLSETVNNFVYIERSGDTLSFISNFDSRFSMLDKMRVRRGALLFDEEELATYLPFVEGYDFRKGGPQAFSAIRQFSPEYPPMKVMLTLRSIRDEYLKIDGRKIKTECLLLRIKDCPQITLWVSKADHSIAAAEIPSQGRRFVRTSTPKEVVPEDLPTPGAVGCREREVFFQNGSVTLAGTLSAPLEEGTYPAAVLLWGAGPQNRDCQGLFSTVASYLSKSGFCVLRFDKRGVRSSGGSFQTYTQDEEISDIAAAINFLGAQKEADGKRMVLIGHARGGYYASKIASTDNRIKACVIMAGTTCVGNSADRLEFLKDIGELLNWDRAYLNTVIGSEMTANEIVANNSQRDWAAVLKRRCFLARMRQELNNRPIETIKGLAVPVLLLHGNKDTVVPPKDSKALNGALDEGGSSRHNLVYFGYLGHFLGDMVFDGSRKIYYRVDPDVLKTLADWLKGNLPQDAGGKL